LSRFGLVRDVQFGSERSHLEVALHGHYSFSVAAECHRRHLNRKLSRKPENGRIEQLIGAKNHDALQLGLRVAVHTQIRVFRAEQSVMCFRDEEAGAALTPERFEFSVPEHITHLAGYMDAVGRVLTTDSELWALTARDARTILDGDLVLGVTVRTRSFVENWSKQFGWLVDDFLGMDQRSRLGFYLIDYICWFKEFTQNAECFKLECEFLTAGTIGQAVYLLQLEGDQRVLLLAQRLDKAHNKPLQPIAREDARSG
jgi:hypothetical protein